jgi:hypothetical protein
MNFIIILLTMLSVIGICVYVLFFYNNVDNSKADLLMRIPKTINLNNCCAVSKSSEKAYCWGGWGKEDLTGPKWSEEKCENAALFLEKCDKSDKPYWGSCS